MSKDLQALSAGQRLAQWSGVVSACRNSGQSVRVWCAENGVNEKTYYYWQRKVFQAMTREEPCFAELPMSSRKAAIAATIRVGNCEADIYTWADKASITAICQALREC